MNPLWMEKAHSLVVFQLAATAIFIPMYPATVEVMAPTKKAMVVQNVPTVGSAIRAMTIAKRITKTPRKVYSLIRKVIAPYIIIKTTYICNLFLDSFHLIKLLLSNVLDGF